jgi:hypothetical protein
MPYGAEAGHLKQFLARTVPVRGRRPAFCPMGAGGNIRGVKRPGREADHTPPSVCLGQEGRDLQSPYFFMSWCLNN